MGRRKDGVCCLCKIKPRRRGQAYCGACHADYMKVQRQKNKAEREELRRGHDLAKAHGLL